MNDLPNARRAILMCNNCKSSSYKVVTFDQVNYRVFCANCESESLDINVEYLPATIQQAIDEEDKEDEPS